MTMIDGNDNNGQQQQTVTAMTMDGDGNGHRQWTEKAKKMVDYDLKGNNDN